MSEATDTQTPNNEESVRCTGLVGDSGRLQNAVRILAGLLASGHYTYESEGDADDPGGTPKLKTWDGGKEWREDGHERRYVRHAIDDAESLLEDMERRLAESPSPLARQRSSVGERRLPQRTFGF